MSWSDAAKPLKALGILVVAASLTACSGFRPLYGESAVPPGRYAFNYAEPTNRLEQVIYTELRLRLGPDSEDASAHRVGVSAWNSAVGLTQTGTAKPATTSQMTVTAAITLTAPDGAVLFSGQRSADALYETVGQVLGDVEGQNEAAERAARAVADTARLSILGALSRQQ